MHDEDKKSKKNGQPEKMNLQEATEEDEQEEEIGKKENPEIEDPQEILRKRCRSKCQKHVDKLDSCSERVLSKIDTREICFEELADLLHCVDHCVAHDLFKHLK